MKMNFNLFLTTNVISIFIFFSPSLATNDEAQQKRGITLLSIFVDEWLPLEFETFPGGPWKNPRPRNSTNMPPCTLSVAG